MNVYSINGKNVISVRFENSLSSSVIEIMASDEFSCVLTLEVTTVRFAKNVSGFSNIKSLMIGI